MLKGRFAFDGNATNIGNDSTFIVDSGSNIGYNSSTSIFNSPAVFTSPRFIEFNKSSQDLFGTNNFSLAFWLYITTAATSCCGFLEAGDATSGFYITINKANSELEGTKNQCIIFNVSGTEIGGNYIQSGTWEHVVCIYKDGQSFLYINEELKETGDNISFVSNTGHILLDKPTQLSSIAGSYLKCNINDLRFYSHALSKLERERLKEVLIWHSTFDKIDDQGHIPNLENSTNYLTLQTGTNITTGNHLYAHSLQTGSKKYGQSNDMLYRTRYALSINIWAYSSDWTTFNNIVFAYNTGGWKIYNNNGNLDFAIKLSSSSEVSNLNTYQSLASIDNTKWHMITCTYDGYIKRVYLDGVLKGQSTSSTDRNSVYYYGTMYLRVGDNGSGVGFTGKISDLRIYGSVLSDAKILEMYNSNPKVKIDTSNNIWAMEFGQNATTKITQYGEFMTNTWIHTTNQISSNNTELVNMDCNRVFGGVMFVEAYTFETSLFTEGEYYKIILSYNFTTFTSMSQDDPPRWAAGVYTETGVYVPQNLTTTNIITNALSEENLIPILSQSNGSYVQEAIFLVPIGYKQTHSKVGLGFARGNPYSSGTVILKNIKIQKLDMLAQNVVQIKNNSVTSNELYYI